MRGIGTETHICHNKERWERFTYYRNCFDDWIQGGRSRTACGILLFDSNRKLADEALVKMIEDGVIVKVDEPTPWVAPMVVVLKPGQNKVIIYTELNKHILREFHPMATVDSSLAQLGQGQIFPRLMQKADFGKFLQAKNLAN
ncbi:hypothetical protein EB796_025129 [Bugula neritina]|uniref:Uncharacterized protein n=1 Tax=Bugula neritina TaxID=10212 RepID=A0A7J7IRI0_BUGNE|nr:hypothetical protein EB796_025129 [Bugula neritina]